MNILKFFVLFFLTSAPFVSASVVHFTEIEQGEASKSFLISIDYEKEEPLTVIDLFFYPKNFPADNYSISIDTEIKNIDSTNVSCKDNICNCKILSYTDPYLQYFDNNISVCKLTVSYTESENILFDIDKSKSRIGNRDPYSEISIVQDDVSEECVSEWECGEWSKCDFGEQKRSCKDLAECELEIENRPIEIKKCDDNCDSEWECNNDCSGENTCKCDCEDSQSCFGNDNIENNCFDNFFIINPKGIYNKGNIIISWYPDEQISGYYYSLDRTNVELKYQDNFEKQNTNINSLSLNDLVNGKYFFKIIALNKNGIYSEILEYNFIVDDNKPDSINMDVVNMGITEGSYPIVKYSASDLFSNIDYYEIVCDGFLVYEGTDNQFIFDTPRSIAESCNIRVYDISRNMSESVINFELSSDGTRRYIKDIDATPKYKKSNKELFLFYIKWVVLFFTTLLIILLVIYNVTIFKKKRKETLEKSTETQD